MVAIPAIDIIDGRCVRLTEGSFDSVKVYGGHPAATAKSFAQDGAERLHVVDLDAARGKGDNRPGIATIREAFSGVLEVGGGVRTSDDVQQLLDLGADRIVVGTALATKPKEVEHWISLYGGVFIAGIDARDGMVKISGWQQSSEIEAADLAVQSRDMGMVEIIYTNIARDGTMKGPDIDYAASLADISGIPVILSGGVGSMSDLEQLAMKPSSGISGIIFGMALYEGRINLPKAISILGGGI
ncbi:MAG: 1-(5-phosphoribosyl)-5-[(5-phosphoribosylamino)methylideneamino]imidazole-4-carboxamide isomerase [spirochete symbiont of Stewartia floridana]|nr:MAG: 1-(5-phosphoribosyl)-5-[(5-phosphoribosylamino)methylideneamino]imidazole-4-carboxamide isomerase [spirochete symbiont of Stewartia floridana]